MAKAKTIKEQAIAAGIEPSVVYQRIKTGWTLEKALSTPTRRRRPNRKPTKSQIDLQRQYRAVVEELEQAQAELAFGAKRCKLIALTCSVLIALMAAVIVTGVGG